MAQGFDPSRLITALNNTGLQQKDNPLYQVLFQLIKSLSSSSGSSSSSSGSSSSSTVIEEVTNFLTDLGSELNGNQADDLSSLITIPFSFNQLNFTTGSVIFVGSDGELTQDNANFFWDDANDQLQLKSATNVQLLLTQTGTGNSGIHFVRSGGTVSDWIIYLKPSTDDLYFFSGSDRAFLNESGLFHAAAFESETIINVGATPALSGTIRIPNNTAGISARNAANSGDVGIFTVNASDQIVFGLTGSGSILFNPGNTEVMRAVNAAGLQMVSARAIYWDARTVLTSTADGRLTLTNNAGSSGFSVNGNTADTMTVANQAHSAYGTIDCLGLKASGVAGFNGTVTPVVSITVTNGIVTAIS